MIAHPPRDEIIKLREDHKMTREEIADHYDVSLATVRRWIKELQIPRPKSKSDRSQKPERRRRDDGLTSMERARIVLGPRLIEKIGHGYYLDGKPASVSEILDAAGEGRSPE